MASKAITTDIYKILQPETQIIPVVFDAPHAGQIHPSDFHPACTHDLLRRAEDSFTDELFDRAPDIGAPIISALFPRSYLDVNRAENDIDPDLLESDWPEAKPTFRSAAGHGIIHRLIRAGVPIYDQRLKIEDVKRRIDTYYKPYHAALKKLLDDTHYTFGQVTLIDCHSMNSLNSKYSAFTLGEADFVLGDRDGTSCDPKFTRDIKDFLEGLHYKVFINDPYKGVEILRRYSNPQMGRSGIQIEINKGLYLDEEGYKKNKNYNKLKDNIHLLCKFIADQTSAQKISQTTSMAAD